MRTSLALSLALSASGTALLASTVLGVHGAGVVLVGYGMAIHATS